jgi:hypothetical protein
VGGQAERQQQVLAARRCRQRAAQHLFVRLPFGDVEPRADDLPRGAGGIAHQVHFVAHPAIAAVLVPEAVLVGVMALLEQARQLGQDGLGILRVDVADPEVRIVGKLVRLIAQLGSDVRADERGAVIARGFGDIDHRRAGGQHVCQEALGRLLFADGHVQLRRPLGDALRQLGVHLADLIGL